MNMKCPICGVAELVHDTRVIVLWESAKPAGRRTPPLLLAGMGEEKGDILTGPPASDWATAVEQQVQLISVDERFLDYQELTGLLVKG